MKVVGLTGGIGTGKSTVADLLRQRGWIVIASDETARSIMDTDQALQAELRAILGDDIQDEHGNMKRALIAQRIFGSTDESAARKRAVERLIHPRVLDAHMDLLLQHRDAGAPLVAIESALLYEIGLEDAFDWIIVVDAADDVRIQRVMERNGSSREDVLARINEQMPMSEKRGHADFVITNSTTRASLQQAVTLVATVIEALPDPETSPMDAD
ncbi:MAG: dephospho-CoA kinase [Candidatus Kapabacteria bacterium]|jgi:dephospho-CoA kinase|nr:dephospho-CoA kinase [Candidatus Kapabacteria bacterium]